MCNVIRGNVITVLLDRRIVSFVVEGALPLAEAFPDCFAPGVKTGTAEKVFRLSCFLSMLTAGLREEKQRSMWVSDHDEALDSYDRRERFARLTHNLTIAFTGWQEPAMLEFTTTESPFAPSSAEDVASIPDLIAGACCKLSSFLPTYRTTETWKTTVSLNPTVDRRASVIGNWMAATAGAPLRKVLLRLEMGGDGLPHASAQAFAGAG